MNITSRMSSIVRNSKILAIARVLLFLVCCTLALIATSALPLARSGKTSLLFLAIVSSVGAFLITWAFTHWDSISLTSVGVGFGRGSITRLAFGLAVGFVILGAQWALMFVCGRVQLKFSQLFSLSTFVPIATAFLFLSAREELAFHGFALQRLRSIVGLWPAQMAIAAVFALEHMAGGTSPINALAGACMGSLLFGMAAIATRGLAVPIGIHAAWNIGDWLRGGKETPGMWRLVVEPGYESYVQATGLFTYMMVMALSTFGFWLLYRTRQAAHEA